MSEVGVGASLDFKYIYISLVFRVNIKNSNAND